MTAPPSKQPAREADKFIVRLPEGMRDRLSDTAAENKRSMNAEAVAMLYEGLEHHRELHRLRAENEALKAELEQFVHRANKAEQLALEREHQVRLMEREAARLEERERELESDRREVSEASKKINALEWLPNNVREQLRARSKASGRSLQEETARAAESGLQAEVEIERLKKALDAMTQARDYVIALPKEPKDWLPEPMGKKVEDAAKVSGRAVDEEIVALIEDGLASLDEIERMTGAVDAQRNLLKITGYLVKELSQMVEPSKDREHLLQLVARLGGVAEAGDLEACVEAAVALVRYGVEVGTLSASELKKLPNKSSGPTIGARSKRKG